MERIAKETKSLLTTVEYYEQLLSKQNYIAGDVRNSVFLNDLVFDLDLARNPGI
jgi:hypothetical protein